MGQSDKPECRGRGVPAAASPPTESLLQYSPALRRVTTGFGMGPGGATALSATGTPRPPHSCSVRRRSHASHGRRVRPGVVSFVFVKRHRPNRNHCARFIRSLPFRRCPAWGTEPKPCHHPVTIEQRCPRSLGRVGSGLLPAVHLPPINPVVSRGAYL